MRCLRAALRESPLMPLDESLAVLETADDLSRARSLRFTGEDNSL
jgi:hypothetical protein